MKVTMRDLKSLYYIRHKLRTEDVAADERDRLSKKAERLEGYIDSIDDPMVRDMFVYRFVRGFTWVKTAHKIGGGNTADGVRMTVKRYLEKQ